MITTDTLARFSKSFGSFADELAAIREKKAALEQYLSTVSGAPRQPQMLNTPLGQVSVNKVGGIEQGNDDPINWGAFASSPQFAQAMSNPEVSKMLLSLMGAQKTAQDLSDPGLKAYNPEDELRNKQGAVVRPGMPKPIEPKQDTSISEVELAVKASQGDDGARKALQLYNEHKLGLFGKQENLRTQGRIQVDYAKIRPFLLKVGKEGGKDVEYYGYYDASGKEVVTRRQPRNAMYEGEMRKRQDQLTALDSNLSMYETLLNKVAGGRIGGTAANIEQMVEQNPDARLAKGFENSLKGLIARQIGMEVGVLTDQDIERAGAMLPRLIDNPQERKMKFDAIKQLISERKSALGSSQGLGQQADDFVVGQTYQDASGNKAIYRGNGNWEEVK